MERINHSTNSLWEPVVGYSRAVRKGPYVFVAGTTSTDADSGAFVDGDAEEQATRVFANITRALAAVGATPRDVVRTRMFVADIQRDADAIGRAHHAAFVDGARPAATMVEVRGFIDKRMLVEVDVDAIVG
ncbi:hypothetical protein HDU83_003621 [Entophlyctis luteolus]|nr:hypothetical protein HDU83_003621 [Entophlyctis luteolus]